MNGFGSNCPHRRLFRQQCTPSTNNRFSLIHIPHRLLPILMIAALAWTQGCSQQEQVRPKTQVPVKTAEAISQDVPIQLTAIGTVEAYSTVNITSRVSGQVAKLHVQEGRVVEKGQFLFTIDPAYECNDRFIQWQSIFFTDFITLVFVSGVKKAKVYPAGDRHHLSGQSNVS